MQSLGQRLWQALRTLPDAKGWLESAGVSVGAVALIALIAFAGGMVHWLPRFDDWPSRLSVIIVGPALAEEFLFRGMLIPSRGESRYPAAWFAFGITAFILWHVLEAKSFLPGAHLFLTVPFLACAAVLGGACSLMRYRTGSVFPGVFLHGGIVVAWQMLLGGPAIKDLF